MKEIAENQEENELRANNLLQISQHIWCWFMKIWPPVVNHFIWILNIVHSWVNWISTPYCKNEGNFFNYNSGFNISDSIIFSFPFSNTDKTESNSLTFRSSSSRGGNGAGFSSTQTHPAPH